MNHLRLRLDMHPTPKPYILCQHQIPHFIRYQHISKDVGIFFFLNNALLYGVVNNWFFLISEIYIFYHLWWKAIIKLKPFREAPDKKLGVQNDLLLLTRLFTRPKKLKSVLKVRDFCETFWEIFDFFIDSHILKF